MLYGQEDAAKNGARLRNQITLTLCAGALLLVLTGVLFALRLQMPSTVMGALFGATMIFLIDLRIVPLWHYGCLLENLLTGLKRETVGILQEINTQERVLAEGCWFCEATLVMENCGANEENRRLFYFDCAKPIPGELLGKRVTLVSCDKIVVGIMPAREAEHGEQG